MIPPRGDTAIWFQVATRRVVSLFVGALARSHGWQRVFVVSPWISEFGGDAGMSLSQLLKRLQDDDATLYVVSRPPKEAWHRIALERVAASGQANIALVSELHTKLYCAETDQGAFALIGSANLTQLSLTNREIGVLLRSAGAGKPIVRALAYEASEIYRAAGRTLMCQRKF